MNRQLTVLVDSWSLVYQPNSPAALHLLALVANHPQQAKVILALPGEAPDWLPANLSLLIQPTPDSAAARLLWEQRALPELAKRVKADVVHLFGMHPALFTSIPTLVSPAEYPETARVAGFISRLRVSLSAGGMARGGSLLWPSDLPEAPAQTRSLLSAPVSPLVAEESGVSIRAELASLDLPETYILYHGPAGEEELRRLLEAFSWAAGPLGSEYPLVVLGLDAAGRSRLEVLLREYGLESRVRLLPLVKPGVIPEIYRRSTVVFHPAETTAWGGPLRLALATARPLVAGETALADALVGPAAYLAALTQPRALGAALITLVVETELAERLSIAARQRAARWEALTFREGLWKVYCALQASVRRQS